MKFKRFLVSAIVLVILFFPAVALPASVNYHWLSVLFLGGATVLLHYLRKNAKIGNTWVHFIFSEAFFYMLIYSSYIFIEFFSRHIVTAFKYDTFFKGLLLFLVSVAVCYVLVQLFISGLKAIIQFDSWISMPVNNLHMIFVGFFAILGAIAWFAELTNCGLAGDIAMGGILLGFIPSDLISYITPTFASEEKVETPIYEEKIVLDNYTELTKKDGIWVDKNSHEWKQDSDGDWYDDGFRLGV